MVIHPVDEDEGTGGKARIETFVVGQDIDKGERLQWIVEGNRWKASFLLPDDGGTNESGGLLISEVSSLRQRKSDSTDLVRIKHRSDRIETIDRSARVRVYGSRFLAQGEATGACHWGSSKRIELAA